MTRPIPTMLTIETHHAVTVEPRTRAEFFATSLVRAPLGDVLRAVEDYWDQLIGLADCDSTRSRAEATFRAIRQERIGVETEDQISGGRPMTRVRAQPCQSCPYRVDAPSGLWSEEEYAKLPPYDAETFAQPWEAFGCHATPEYLCHGWAVCHSSRGHDRELLALRVSGAEVPEAAVPLFGSGAEAAAHGVRDIAHPSPEACAMMATLAARYERLRKEDTR